MEEEKNENIKVIKLEIQKPMSLAFNLTLGFIIATALMTIIGWLLIINIIIRLV